MPLASSRTLARDEAAAELARRFLQSRAPATLADFTWWSGLRAAEARAAYAAVASSIDPPRKTTPAHDAHLLPAFDEYVVGYEDREAQLARPIEVDGRPDAGARAAIEAAGRRYAAFLGLAPTISVRALRRG